MERADGTAREARPPRGARHDPTAAAPFNRETAQREVRLAEDAWNPPSHKLASAYTIDSRWRNWAEFTAGRDESGAFLTRKWRRR